MTERTQAVIVLVCLLGVTIVAATVAVVFLRTLSW